MTLLEWICIISLTVIALPTVLGGIFCIPFYGGKIIAELRNINTTMKGHSEHLDRTDSRLDNHEGRIVRLEVKAEVDQ